MSDPRPSLVILAGPNGAGKSTVAPVLLHGALAVNEFVNADVIALGLSAFDPEAVAIAAGRVMLMRLRELAEHRASFAFETTLASRSFAPWLRDLRSLGYRVHLLFLWLPSPEFAVERVADRVRAGGHNVPAETVRRRYRAGLRNFFSLYEPLVSAWKEYDSSGLKPALIAERLEAQPLRVYDEAAWTSVRRRGTAIKTEAEKDVHRIFVEESELIDEALAQGVQDAVLLHKRDGLPMVICRDGKTRWVKPEDLSV